MLSLLLLSVMVVSGVMGHLEKVKIDNGQQKQYLNYQS